MTLLLDENLQQSNLGEKLLVEDTHTTLHTVYCSIVCVVIVITVAYVFYNVLYVFLILGIVIDWIKFSRLLLRLSVFNYSLPSFV